jgi:outer membrane lipoprotein-sorting protein
MNPPGARGARAWPRAFVAATALVSVSTLSSLLSASCAAALMKLPAGPGVPAADAAGALAQATAACREIKTLTAEIAITGSAGGHRVRGRLLAGVAAPASVRLEFVAPFGPPLFIFAATGSEATLVLPRDERVVEHGDPAAVLNAVAGVPLDSADVVAMLSGCVPTGAQSGGRELAADWRVVHVSAGTVGYDVYAHRERESLPWRVAVLMRQGPTDKTMRIEYRDVQGELPRLIRLVANNGSRESDFDLTLALSQVERNVSLGPDVFRVEIPRAATPITVDELRRARLGLREN